MNPDKPTSTSPDEEFARYDFRKGASMALGGGALSTNDDSSAPRPKIKKREIKKRAEGGC